jgi:hypothetical protein
METFKQSFVFFPLLNAYGMPNLLLSLIKAAYFKKLDSPQLLLEIELFFVECGRQPPLF